MTPTPSLREDDPIDRVLSLSLCHGVTVADLMHSLNSKDLNHLREIVAKLGASSAGAPPSLNSLGPFTDLVEIGRGGMGVVYRTINPKTLMTVAVKIPSWELTPTSSIRDRFVRESKMMSLLDHPAIIPFLESGEADGRCYIVTEYCDGPDLAQWIRANQTPMPPQEAARIVRTLADAVEHAHQHGIIHRDLKPSNVLLPGARLDSFPEALDPRLTDFGLAKWIDDEMGEFPSPTLSGMLIGTPYYMAPEQADGRKRTVDRRTDVYALGVLLYELLTGRPPFHGKNVAETLRMVCLDEPISPRTLHDGVPRSLDAVVIQCLEKQQDRRYGSAAELRDDLDAFIQGRRVKAKAIQPTERFRRWTRRHPKTFAALSVGLAALAVLIGGTIAWSVSLQQINDDLMRANLKTTTANQELTHQRDLSNRVLYTSQIGKIRETFESGQLFRSQQTLLAQIPIEGEPDSREFTWRYLANLTRREARLFAGQSAWNLTAVLSPNQRWLATASSVQHHQVSLHDLDDDRTVWSFRLEPGEEAIQFAFTSDASRIAIAVHQSYMANVPGGTRIEIRDTASGSLLSTCVSRQGFWIDTLHFLEEERALAGVYTGGSRKDGTYVSQSILWPWTSQDGLIETPSSVRRLSWLATSPDGMTLAAVADDGRVGLHDVRSGSWRFGFSDSQDWVDGYAAFNPTGDRLILCPGKTSNPAVFDVRTGERIASFPTLDSPILSVAFQAGGNGVLFRTASQSVRLIDPSRELDVVIHPASSEIGVTTDRIMSTPDGRGFLVHRGVLHSPPHIELFSAEDGRLLAQSPGRVRGTIGDWIIRTIHDSELIYCQDRYIWRWNWSHALTPAPDDAESVHTDEVWAVAYSRDKNYRVTSGNQEAEPFSLKMWDARTSRLLWKAFGGEGAIVDLAFSPESDRLLTGSLAEKEQVCLWDVATGRKVASYNMPNAEAVRTVEYSPDGKIVYIGGHHGSLRAMDADLKGIVWTFDPPFNSMPYQEPWRIHEVKASADGRHVVSTTDLGPVRFHAADTGRVLFEFSSPTTCYALEYSPDGLNLAAADREGNVHILDARNGELIRSFLGDEIELRDLAYSPDGRTLAVCGLGRKVRIWDPLVGEELLALEGHQAQINGLAFSPDGETLASVDHAGVIRFWRTKPDAPR